MSTTLGVSLESIDNHELLARLRSLLSKSRSADAGLLVHLGEVDARRLYLEEAFPSMFEYCVRGLHMEEGVAYNRIHVARAARQYPELLRALRDGEVHLTGLRLLVPLLTPENCREWIHAARNRSVAELRRLIADHRPKPDVEASICRQRTPSVPRESKAEVPAPAIFSEVKPRSEERAGLSATVPPPPVFAQRPRSEPLGGGRYSVKFTADEEFYETLTDLRALLRHEIPDGDLAEILKRAAAELLTKTRKRKFAELAGERPVKGTARSEVQAPAEEPPVGRSMRVSRHIPHAIQRAVWERDEGCCSFVSSSGRRCASRDFLEFDHLEPWARSRSHSIEGMALRCRAHNQAAARKVFGDRHMDRFLRKQPRHVAAPDPDQVSCVT